MREKGSRTMMHLGNKGMAAIQPGLDHLHAAANEVSQHAIGEAGIVGSQATGMAKNAAKGAITTGRIAAQTAKQVISFNVREAERDSLHPTVHQACGGFGAGGVWRYQGDLHRFGREFSAGVFARPWRRMGHRRIRHATRRDEYP